MSLRELPARPNLEHLKKQARLLLRGSLQAEPAALDRFRDAQVQSATATPKLADAQHVIARRIWVRQLGEFESSCRGSFG